MALKKIISRMFLLLLFLAEIGVAKIRLPSIISDNMVIQQNSRVSIWGWSEPGEKIKVKGSWQWFARKTVANSDGEWIVNIKSPEAGGPFKINIQDSNSEIVLENVLSGEVWLSSGQSNMEMPVKKCKNAEQELSSANYPKIRLFDIKRKKSPKPLKNCSGTWEMSDSSTVEDFSGLAYFFSRKIHYELDVPVGIINASWGGTPVEAWMPEKALKPEFQEIYEMWEKWESRLKIVKKEYKSYDNAPLPTEMYMDKRPHRKPAVLFNGMINPVLKYNLKGLIWCQGSSNRNRALQYRELFPAMIKSWREIFNQGELPFYYVQNAPYNFNTNAIKLPLLQEAQALGMKLPKTGMVVTLDIGNLDDIHYRNKQEAGRRLALWALAKTYKRNMAYSGPIYKDMKIINNKIKITFNHIGSGLKKSGDELKGFTIADSSRIFAKAKAKIVDDFIIVSNKEIEEPVAVRYGWALTGKENLFNKEGLPAAPFRTDKFDVPIPEGRPYKIKIQKDVPYLSKGRKGKLDLYYPLYRDKNVKSPGIVIIHGGGMVGGDKARDREKNIGKVLARHGFVCASINYKLADGENPVFPDNLKDCKRAVQFLRKNADKYKIDKENIGVIGGSSGGQLALLLGFTGNEAELQPNKLYPGISSRVQAVVDLYGITNLLTRQKIDEQGNPTGKLKNGSAVKVLQATREENPEIWKACSPVTYITENLPPVLILHGKADKTVDYLQSVDLAQKLESVGAEYNFYLIPGFGHTFSLQYDVMERKLPHDLSLLVIEFFNKHLKGH